MLNERSALAFSVCKARFARPLKFLSFCPTEIEIQRSLLTSWGRNINSRKGCRRRPLIDHLLLHGNDAGAQRLLCQGHYHELRFEQRALQHRPHDGEEGGVLRAWRRIKAEYKGHSERALGFLPWMAMKNEHFNELLRCGLWKIMTAFEVGLDGGLWSATAKLDCSIIKAFFGLFYVLYQKELRSLALAFMAKRLEICTKNTTDFSTDSIHIVGVFFSVASLGLGPTTIGNYSIRYLE